MTKKEIEDCIWSNKEINTIGKIEAQNAIDLMHDAFKSRTCENCKYFGLAYRHHRDTDRTKRWCFKLCFETPQEYGCNKFERKTD